MTDESIHLGQYNRGSIARIKEAPNADMTEKEAVRVYSVSPRLGAVQIRVQGPITANRKGAARNMIATAMMNEEELSQLAYLIHGEIARLRGMVYAEADDGFADECR